MLKNAEVGNSGNESISVEGKRMWIAVVDQALQDLQKAYGRRATEAAQYFFTAPVPEEERDPHTFAGACGVIGFRHDAAARSIFKKLPPLRQRYIRSVLQESCR
ncbi:MAG TPA: hypothetical protein VHZ04_00520 [Candidatus Paceibacterota bacterium]|jgi:hypothetical protein|nr:hypothetical protein [Candidatus Paceibacterota bacterium]